MIEIPEMSKGQGVLQRYKMVALLDAICSHER
jgi:hypothetical protein